MTFEEDLAAQTEAPRPTTDVSILLNKKLYLLRFTQLDPIDWADETDRHPARPQALIDLAYGYNLRTLVRAILPRCGVLVEGESTKPLPEAQWDLLLGAVDGQALQAIGNAIFELNVYGPEEEIKAAKKELADSARNSA